MPALLLAPALAWTQGRGVDLSDQFPDPPTRRQDKGNCHAFAAVGLLEAAYYRAYRAHLRLSERDLFVGNTILSGQAVMPFFHGQAPTLEEGGSTQQDEEGLSLPPEREAEPVPLNDRLVPAPDPRLR